MPTRCILHFSPTTYHHLGPGFRHFQPRLLPPGIFLPGLSFQPILQLSVRQVYLNCYSDPFSFILKTCQWCFLAYSISFKYFNMTDEVQCDLGLCQSLNSSLASLRSTPPPHTFHNLNSVYCWVSIYMHSCMRSFPPSFFLPLKIISK